MIPKVFHRVVPATIPPLFDTWWHQFQQLHPGWDFVTWRDPLDPADFELSHLWERCTAGAQLAGLVRLEVVWRHGGIYVDMDFEPRKPFDPLLSNRLFIGTEDGHVLTDAVFGAEPRHRGLRAAIDAFHDGYWSRNPSDTGPLHTTRHLSGRDDVTVCPTDWFYPYLWTEPQRAGDDFPNAYAIHRWNHSWRDWQHTDASELP